MLQNGIRADSRGFTGVCGSGVRAWCTSTWRVSARASGMRHWHWTHGRGTGTIGTGRTDVAHGLLALWTYGTWPREDVSGLGLTDEDVSLLRGEHVTPWPRA